MIITTTNDPVEGTPVAATSVDVQKTSEQNSEAVNKEAVENTEVTKVEGTEGHHADDSLEMDDDDLDGDDDQGSDAVQGKRKNGFQKRMARQARKHEEELNKLREELAFIKGRTSAEPVQAQPQVVQADEAPKLEDYADNFMGYVDALTEYKAQQVVKKTLAETETTKVVKTRESKWVDKVREAQKTIPNLIEVLQRVPQDIPSPHPDTFVYMQESDVGPELAYHFAKNENELRKLVALPPYLQAIQVAKVEAALQAKKQPQAASEPVKKTTQAPAPAQTLEGGSAPQNVSLADLADNYPAWKAKRDEMDKAKGRRR